MPKRSSGSGRSREWGFKPLPLDVVAVLFAIGAILGVSSFAYAAAGGEPTARIEAGGETFLYPLDTQMQFQPIDREGSCVIEIENGEVRVVSSNCPQQICISMGAVSVPGQWIACLPHQVFIRVTGGTSSMEVDGGTF